MVIMKKNYKKLVEEITKEAQRKQDPAAIPGWTSGLNLFGDPPKTNTPIVLNQPGQTPPPQPQGGGQTGGTPPANTGGGWGNLGFGGGSGGTTTTNWSAPSGGGGGGGGGSHVGGAGVIPIREMQKAIKDFATEAVKYNTTPKQEGGKVVRTVNPDDKRRDFNDFLAEQFSASADIHGDEYTTDQSATSQESKQPTDLVQLNNVIDGLQRVGPGNRESMVDGVWDFRTNNAVRNTYALAAALVTANEALGGTAPNDRRVFKRSDLQNLAKAIPEQKDPYKEGVSQAELGEKAKTIAALVKKLTDFYTYYSKTIMEHPAYKRYIEGNIPLFTVKPGGGDPAQLDENQAKQLQENGKRWTIFSLVLPNKEGRNVDLSGQIPLDYLTSRRNLQQLMIDKLGYQASEVNNGPLLVKLVKSMVAQVSDYISKHKPIPVPPKPQQQMGDQPAPQGRNQLA